MTPYTSFLRRAACQWLSLAAVSTITCGLVYVTVQQDLRQSADDPQIQLAEDAAARLATGAPPSTVVASQTVDMASSLAPFLIVFDESGHVVASTGRLNGEVPTPPSGVFDEVRAGRENRVTWQPRHDTRFAAVVTRYDGAAQGFVLAGRSLREVEKREAQTGAFAAAAWMASLIVTFGLVLLVERQERRQT